MALFNQPGAMNGAKMVDYLARGRNSNMMVESGLCLLHKSSNNEYKLYPRFTL